MFVHITMNIHRCIELKFFDCQHSEEQKTISNNSIPVNVHTDFLFRLLKNVANMNIFRFFIQRPLTLGRWLGVRILRISRFASSVFSNFLFAVVSFNLNLTTCPRRLPCQWLRIIGSLRFCASIKRLNIAKT